MTIDFENVPAGYQATYTESAVTFLADGTGTIVSMPNPVAGEGNGILVAFSDLSGPVDVFSPGRANIAGGTNFVSLDLGDFGSDSDGLFLNAFDSSDMMIAQDTQAIDNNRQMVTLSVSAPNIAYVIWGSRAPSKTDHSVICDNFAWQP